MVSGHMCLQICHVAQVFEADVADFTHCMALFPVFNACLCSERKLLVSHRSDWMNCAKLAWCLPQTSDLSRSRSVGAEEVIAADN